MSNISLSFFRNIILNPFYKHFIDCFIWIYFEKTFLYPESVMLASCLLFRYIGIFGSCIMVFFLFYGFGFLGQISFSKWYVKDHLIVTFKIYLKDRGTQRGKKTGGKIFHWFLPYTNCMQQINLVQVEYNSQKICDNISHWFLSP